MCQHVERAGFGPLKIVEHEHDRTLPSREGANEPIESQNETLGSELEPSVGERWRRSDDARQCRKEAGAHAYFMFPSYIDRSYSINAGAIDSLRRKLEKGMRLPIIGTAGDFAYPKNYFFDTRYHLNEEGRRLRSLRMIVMLRDRAARDGWLAESAARADTPAPSAPGN